MENALAFSHSQEQAAGPNAGIPTQKPPWGGGWLGSQGSISTWERSYLVQLQLYISAAGGMDTLLNISKFLFLRLCNQDNTSTYLIS